MASSGPAPSSLPKKAGPVNMFALPHPRRVLSGALPQNGETFVLPILPLWLSSCHRRTPGQAGHLQGSMGGRNQPAIPGLLGLTSSVAASENEVGLGMEAFLDFFSLTGNYLFFFKFLQACLFLWECMYAASSPLK